MLGKRLKAARKAAGMTQKEAAAAIGVTESTYCGYETGKRSPDPRKISALAKVFDVSGDFLLDTGFEETKKEPAPETGNELRKKVDDILKSLDPFEMAQVIAYAEGLKASRKEE